MRPEGKLEMLKAYLGNLGSCAVAFSGGVDSSFLTAVAHDALGNKAIAFTIDSPYIPRWELEEAKDIAKRIGIRHEIVVLGIGENIRDNPKERCYLCKTAVFSEIVKRSKVLGIPEVLDGTNADDLGDYRPGLKALAELSVKSPLLELGFTKSDIRGLSKSLGLPTWDKPAYACLLSRLPHGTPITIGELRSIEEAERFLMERGFRAVRVRSHGNIARIEVAREERRKLFDVALLDEISAKLKSLGYAFVTIECEGYKTGSMN